MCLCHIYLFGASSVNCFLQICLIFTNLIYITMNSKWVPCLCLDKWNKQIKKNLFVLMVSSGLVLFHSFRILLQLLICKKYINKCWINLKSTTDFSYVWLHCIKSRKIYSSFDFNVAKKLDTWVKHCMIILACCIFNVISSICNIL